MFILVPTVGVHKDEKTQKVYGFIYGLFDFAVAVVLPFGYQNDPTWCNVHFLVRQGIGAGIGVIMAQVV